MLKKLIATSAAAAVVSSQVLVGITYGAPVVTDPEMIDSISWGYDAGLTKYSGTDSFMPYSNLTREQFAKFASEFGVSVLGLEEVAGNCSFTDTAEADYTLTESIVASCELGLMMGYQGKFMPKQEVTRGQVATVVSRMLGEIDPMSSEQAHFELLNSMGIMKYAMLSQSILRGDMMLMLYRLAIDNNGLCDIDPSLCNPGNGTGTTNPPVVKEGNLNISMNSASPANLSSVPQAGSVKFATVDFTAGSKNISVNSVTLERSGLGNTSDISRVYFEKDGIRISSRSSVSSDQTVTLSFAPAWVIAAGTSESVDLYVDMAAATAGGEHMFKSTAINSSAANVVGMITTPTLRTANYTVSTVTFTGAGAGLTATATDADNIELGQFRLADVSTSTDERDLLFKSITLRTEGSADLSNVADIALYRNGTKVSTVAISNGKEVTFGLGAGDEIKDGQTANYYIRGNITYVDNQSGDTYQFRLRNTSDLNVIESTTSFRAAISGTAYLPTYTINGADVMFKRDASFALSDTVSPGVNGAVLLKGTISSKTPIYLEDIILPVTIGMSGNTIANSFRLRIGGSTFTWTPTAASSGAINATFDGAVAINGTAEVELTADIKSNAPSTSVKFGPLQLSDFQIKEYQNNQNSIQTSASVGSIEGANISIISSNLAVTRNDGISSKSIVNGAQNQLLFGATFSTSQDNAIRISQLTLSGATSTGIVPAAAFNSNLTATLYDGNGNAVKTANYTNGKITFFGLNINVAKNNPVNWTVRGNFTAGATGTLRLTLTDVDAVDMVTSNTISVSDVAGGALTIDGSATLDVAANSSLQSQMIYGGQQNVTIAQFNLEGQKDATDITDLYLASNGNLGTSLANHINNVQLTDGTNSWFGSIRNGVIAFENMSNNELSLSATKTYSVKADVSNVTSTASVTTGFTFSISTGAITNAAIGQTNGIRAISKSNGQLVTTVDGTSSPVSATTRIVRGAVSIAKVNITPTNSEFARFDVTAKGNRVQVTGFTIDLVNVTGAGQTGVAINVYKNGLGGDLVYSGSAGAIQFSGAGANIPVEITNNSTMTFSVKVLNPIPTLNGTTSNKMGATLSALSYLDKLDDGDVVITDATSYKNVGNFPMTWSE